MSSSIQEEVRALRVGERVPSVGSERHRGGRGVWQGYMVAVAGVAAMTLAIHWIGHYARIANISVLYLLAILAVALRHGTGPAIVASVLAFLAFDWFFVAPHGRLTVHDPAEWVALLMFLAVGLITGQLAGRLREREAEARRRAEETEALERMSWSVASQLEEQAILDEVVRRVVSVAPVAAAVVLRAPHDGEAGEAGVWQLAAVSQGSRVKGQGSRDRDGSARVVGRDPRPVTDEVLVPDFRTGAMAHAATACFTGGRPLGWEGSMALWEKGYREPGEESRVAGHESRVGTDPAGHATRDARPVTQGGTDPAGRATHDSRLVTNGRPAFLPLIAQGRAVGVLYLQPVAPLSHGERRLIESLANHAAVALARERLVQEAARVRGLEEADKLKDALLSMVSHDFRSPLASIKAAITGLLQDEGEWDPALRRELLVGVDQETNRLNRLVEDLLDMSRLEAGAWRPEREPCAVTDLVALALGLLTPEQDARVVVHVPEDLPAVSADAGQMGRVLWNLLDNALKYSEGPVEVSAGAAGEVLILTVADRGPGLAPGEEEQVFAKFYRGVRFRESNVPGSGLGLSVCRALVEAHGGRMSAANRPGGGAEFRVELPCDAHPDH